MNFMDEAIKLAQKAEKRGEIPVGAVVVMNNKIIGRGYNCKENKYNPIMHAEIIAISKACKKIKNWRLNDCVLYTTLEPCNMCKAAIADSRIKKVIYGASASNYKKTNLNDIIYSKIENIDKINYCEKILKKFFEKKRT